MRIRSLKPDFFKDEELAELPPLTRILFEGLWCLADKEGRLEDRPKYIKAEVLPYDNCDVEKMLQVLHDAKKGEAIEKQQGSNRNGFITRYHANGRSYIQINAFKKNQRISGKEAETASEYPPPPKRSTEGIACEAIEKQPGSIGDQLESQEGKGREGKGKEGKGPHVPGGAEQLQQIWNKYAKTSRLVECKALSKERRVKANLRLSARPIEEWQAIISKMALTPFLNGQGSRGWRADFDWLVANDTNALRVMEGKYDDTGGNSSSQAENRSRSGGPKPDLAVYEEFSR